MAVISAKVAGSTSQLFPKFALEKTNLPNSPVGSNFSVNSSFINLPSNNRCVGSVITNGVAAFAGLRVENGAMKIKVKTKNINRLTVLIHQILQSIYVHQGMPTCLQSLQLETTAHHQPR